MANQHQPVDLPEILWNSYSSYRTALQTWLVSYGVGVPGLALTNEWIYKRITIPGVAQEIKLYILLFLSGVGLQVAVATANKTAMWVCFAGLKGLSSTTTVGYTISNWYLRRIWIDIVVDLITIALFVITTYKVYVVLASTPLTPSL